VSIFRAIARSGSAPRHHNILPSRDFRFDVGGGGT
jgi:hypothetical protein